MSDAPPPLPPELPPQQQPPQQEFYFHGPPEELKSELGGLAIGIMVLMHVLGLGALVAISMNNVPVGYREDMKLSYGLGGAIGSFVVVCIAFLIGRRLLRHLNPNTAQPALLLICYAAMIVLPMSLRGNLKVVTARTNNREAVSKYRQKARELHRAQEKEKERETIFKVNSGDIEAQKNAWDEMVASVDTKEMSPAERKIFEATRIIVGEVMEAGQRFAAEKDAADELNPGGMATHEKIVAGKKSSEDLRRANADMRTFIQSLPNRITEVMDEKGVSSRDAADFKRTFLQQMAFDSQLAVRKLEDERLDAMGVLMELLLHHEGTWEFSDGQFLFEDDQAIEDYNVIVDEIERLETEIADHQTKILNAGKAAQNNGL